MSKRSVPKLSESEWEVMKPLWEQGPMAARDIYAALPEGHEWAYQTVKTMLARLVKKGALKTTQVGNSYLYETACSREAFTRAAAGSFVQRVFDGALQPFMAYFAEEASPEEIRQMRAELEAIEQAKRGGRGEAMNALAVLEAAAHTWQAWMGAMAWQVALLAVMVWCVTRVLYRGPAHVRFALWGLVIVRLVLPPTLSTPWSAGEVAAKVVPPAAIGQIVDTGVPQQDVKAAFPEVASHEQSAAVDRLDAAGTFSPGLVLFVAWATVALGVLGAMIFQYLRYMRRVRRALSLAPTRLEHLLLQQLGRFKMPNTVLLRTSDWIARPGVLGVAPPLIVLPTNWGEGLSDEAVGHVLAHELAHIRRRDLPLAWLIAAVTCLYWFHPAVWVANLYLRREREMACDDMVLYQEKSEGERYASTILTLSERLGGTVPAGAGFLGILEQRGNLRVRMRAAIDPRRQRRWPRLATAAALACMMLFLPMAASKAATSGGEVEPLSVVQKAQEEVEAYYQAAGPEEKEYIVWTAKQFGGAAGLWLPHDYFEGLSMPERAEKVAYLAELLEKSEYGRHLCPSLAEAGALGDTALVPGLIKVAAYHREGDYDCRPKWMAVAALGRTEDPRAIPILIPLVDHGNQNTRIWARASLARLTGQSFGGDKQAWGQWWNSTGRQPRLTEEDLAPWKPGESPSVVSCHPEPGATDVSPDLTEIVVIFSEPMSTGGYSWTGGPPNFPETAGKPFWRDDRTCVLPVKLEPGRFYALGINSKSYQNFKSANGVPATPSVIEFTTQGAGSEAVRNLQAPEVVSLNPLNGTTNISPSTDRLTVLFNMPMGEGFSFAGGGDHFPETTGRPTWNEDRTACSLPVALKPNWVYVLSLNSKSHNNFRSAAGVPLGRVVWRFSTGN